MQLDVSQRDVAVFLAGEEIEQASSNAGISTQDNGRAFLTRDEQWVAFCPNAAVVQSAAGSRIEDWCASQDAQTLIDALQAHGCPAAIVNAGSRMYAMFQKRSAYVFAHSPDGAMVKGFPFQFMANPMSIRLNSPLVGEHTERFCSATD